MKSEWKVEPLRNLVKYVAKGIPPVYVEKEEEASTVRVLNQKCNRDFTISYAESRLHDLSKRKVPQDKYVCLGDVLINSTGTGTAGRIAQIERVPCPTIIDGHMIVLRNNSKLIASYFGYALKAHQDEILKLDEGSTGQTELNRERLLSEILISYPVSHEMQHDIADTLAALDARIAENKRINHHLEQMAQLTFKRLIIDANADEPLGILSDIADINPSRTLLRGQEAVYIEMANLPTNGSFPSDWTMRPYSGGMKFTNGDTIMARITPCLENGKTAYINFLEEGAVAFGSTEYIVITSKLEYGNEVFYYLTRHPDFVNYAIRNMNGTSGRQRVSGDAIGRYGLHVPRKEAIREFSEFSAPIMDKIRQNALESRNLAALRDALLPKLMSGELSVADLPGSK
ncbi:MAG: restriction endonuclease subunit S [Clostridia bacterium]